MELSIALGLGGWIVVIVGALIFGVLAQFVGEADTGYAWLGDAIGAGLGAVVASEFIVGWRDFGPTWDGLAMGPALIGGIALGFVVELVTRLLTGGRNTGPEPIR